MEKPMSGRTDPHCPCQDMFYTRANICNAFFQDVQIFVRLQAYFHFSSPTVTCNSATKATLNPGFAYVLPALNFSVYLYWG